jgi:hypothetical protein
VSFVETLHRNVFERCGRVSVMILGDVAVQRLYKMHIFSFIYYFFTNKTLIFQLDYQKRGYFSFSLMLFCLFGINSIDFKNYELVIS